MAPRDFIFVPEISEMSDYYTNFAGRESDEDIYTDTEDDSVVNSSANAEEEFVFESETESDSEYEISYNNEQAEQARGAIDVNIVDNYSIISKVWREQRDQYVDYKMNEYRSRNSDEVSEEILHGLRLHHYQEFTQFAETEWFRGSFFIKSQMNAQENILASGLTLQQISNMLRQPRHTWESYLKEYLGEGFNRQILPSELHT